VVYWVVSVEVKMQGFEGIHPEKLALLKGEVGGV
jgi:hypothetical protein